MKESQFIGTLMPSHPDFQPIIQDIREKYQLSEVDPDGEPIKAVYLVQSTIPLVTDDNRKGEFLQRIQSSVFTEISKRIDFLRYESLVKQFEMDLVRSNQVFLL